MSVDTSFSLAISAHRAGRFAEAERLYLEVLAGEHEHWGACFGLAQVLIRLERFDEAIGWLMPLLDRHGDHAAVYRQLGLAEVRAGRSQHALVHFQRVLEYVPDDAAIVHIVASLQQTLNLDGDAQASFRHALKLKPLITVPAVVAPADFRALFVFAPNAGNTPLDFLIERARFESNIVMLLPDTEYDVESLRANADVVVNLISDVDLGEAMLGQAQALVTRIGGPLVNPPHLIAQTSRDAVARRLDGLPGCRVPRTSLYTADELRAMLSGVGSPPQAFPLLVRPAGTHGGDDFEKIEDAAQLLAFVDRLDAQRFYLTPYVDYRSGDGYFRKYRFVYVDADIFPYHLAIDDKWKIHHASTDMANHAWMQDEERVFLTDPWDVFGEAQRQGLHAIRGAIGLDYFGIDCALDQDGAVVVFEVNATMLVHGDNAQFPYKTVAVERIRAAFQAMLERRSLSGTSNPLPSA
jgi:glutathione synthase/RimK-type ligase-like ATP-grasp enzyme